MSVSSQPRKTRWPESPAAISGSTNTVPLPVSIPTTGGGGGCRPGGCDQDGGVMEKTVLRLADLRDSGNQSSGWVLEPLVGAGVGAPSEQAMAPLA